MIESVDAGYRHPSPLRGMLLTDLDGTLMGSDRTIAPEVRASLSELGRDGFLRVVATGRNPHSYDRSAGVGAEVDYAILSSGAAVRHEATGAYVRTVALEREEVWSAALALLELDMDFMVLDPLPGNHTFAHHPGSRTTDDYHRRIELYAAYERPLVPPGEPPLGRDLGRLRLLWPGPASQLLAIEPPGSPRDAWSLLRPRLGGHTVLRSSSPLGSGATWVEIFPATVSKGMTAAWLAALCGLGPDQVLCVGNDFNDEDMLEWAGTSYVVANAPGDLRRRFPVVASADQGGVAEAVRRWRERKSPRAKGGENPGGQADSYPNP